MSRARRHLGVGLVVALTATVCLAVGPSSALAAPTEPITWGDVSTGGDHTCGVRPDDSLWCWGSNSHGQLGLGDTADRRHPVQVQPGVRWITVRTGYRHTCAIRVDTTLHCWGGNEFGQLGTGPGTTSVSRPTLVSGPWVSVDTSFFHTCAITADGGARSGSLWCWGSNGEGQLGFGDRFIRESPAQVSPGPWSQVRTGYAHTCGLTSTGEVFCWGRGDHGQLGLGDNADRLTPQAVAFPVPYDYASVAVGADHTCAVLRVRLSLLCWGRNHQGQLGLGTYSSTNVPVTVPVPASAPAGDEFDTVSTQDSHTCGRTFPSRTQWCWGWNAFGQLGVGTTTGSPSPRRLDLRAALMSPGVAHTCALRTDRTLWCWGKNTYGQLGLGDTVDRTVPTVIGPSPTVPPPTA